jgi:arylsulfatase A-like enzyme
VAAAEATESRRALRALCLLAVLVSAKTITLAVHRNLAFSIWAPLAYFWQDVLVAVIFLLLDALIRRPAIAWTLYALVAVYTAINVPVAMVLSTPLTWRLLRATGGALADSIAHYVTAANVFSLVTPLAVAVVLPWFLSSRRITVRARSAVAAVPLIVLGPIAVSRIDTQGLHRNAIVALLGTSGSRLDPMSGGGEWRASPFGPSAGDDLLRFSGSLKGRNVVVVVLESTAARYLGIYGADQDPAPRLAGLARDGLVFDRAYAVYPESIKGLFALLCSRYPAFDTAPELYGQVACASLARRFRDAGYRTALFHSGRFDYLAMHSVIDNRGFDTLEDAGAISGQVHSSFGVDDAFTVGRMLSWIDAREAATPFFVVYLPVAGHHPYVSTSAGPFTGGDDFTRYLNALHEGDAALGNLIDGLRDRGVDRDTVYVVFGDHGEAFGQHPGNFAHTLFIYEENVRVPLVIAAPGALRDTRVRQLASVIDIAPTLLDLAGLPVPSASEYDGRSLLSPAPRMALFYTDYSLGWLGLADGCWKYLFELEAGRSRLFDVCADPGETRDRSLELPERVAFYRERVQNWARAERSRITEAAAAAGQK